MGNNNELIELAKNAPEHWDKCLIFLISLFILEFFVDRGVDSWEYQFDKFLVRLAGFVVSFTQISITSQCFEIQGFVGHAFFVVINTVIAFIISMFFNGIVSVGMGRFLLSWLWFSFTIMLMMA